MKFQKSMEFNLTRKNHGIEPKYRDNQNEFGVVLARIL